MYSFMDTLQNGVSEWSNLVVYFTRGNCYAFPTSAAAMELYRCITARLQLCGGLCRSPTLSVVQLAATAERRVRTASPVLALRRRSVVEVCSWEAGPARR